MQAASTRYLTRLLPVVGLLASLLVLSSFHRIPVTHRLYTPILTIMIMFAAAGTTLLLRLYSKKYARGVFWVFHGLVFLALTALATAYAADYFLGGELLGPNQVLIKRALYLQLLAASVLAVPIAYPELPSRIRLRRAGDALPKELVAVYVFVALYPVQHYVTSNTDAFTPILVLEFALISALLPAALLCVIFVYLQPFVSDRLHYFCGVTTAIAIFTWYMRPLYRDLSTTLAVAAGIQWQGFSLIPPISLVMLFLAYRFRSLVFPFLSILMVLQSANFGFVLYLANDSDGSPLGQLEDSQLSLEVTPSVYLVVADGYLNLEGLTSKRLERLSAGADLATRGFRVYDNAYSNYKPSTESMAAFFGIAHHYYRPNPNWESLMTGDNRLYSVMRANGYKTVVAHPNDYLLQGRCYSDVCYPAPGIFGQIGFILAETIFYRQDFTDRTWVGKGQYRRDFYQILEETQAPAIVYSHNRYPNHGPRGCLDETAALEDYEEGLHEANQWIADTVDKIDSIDRNAIIMIFGDHGAFIADNCTWSDPDVGSREVVSDNLGILMAVRWPADYDGRYDDSIHTLMDLSWYLLQYLSDGQMDEVDKPSSASYLVRESEGRMFEVVQDGAIISNPIGYDIGATP